MSLKKKLLLFGTILAIMLSMFPIPLRAYDVIEVNVYEDLVPLTFMETGGGSHVAKNSPYAGGIGTSSVTSAHYDLRNVKKMKTTISASAGGWTSSSTGFQWRDKNGVAIAALNVGSGVEVDVEAISLTYDLSDVYCYGWCSGSAYLPHGAGDSTDAWPGYWYVRVDNLTATVTEGNPRGPRFTTNPGSNLTLVGKSQKICALIAILTIKTHVQSAFI